MKKRLITADTVRAAHAEGKTRIDIVLPCIVTPEARVVAEHLAVSLVEAGQAQAAATPVAAPVVVTPGSNVAPSDDDAMQAIREAIRARLQDESVPEALIDQLVRKAAAELAGSALSDPDTLASGIKCVRGASVRMGIFDGAPGCQVGIADVITGNDGSAMAGGFMQWENAFFPWTLNYDEIDLVLDGELHIRSNGQTVIGRAGDVVFIPKGSSIEFGTPTSVRFFYVAYPANWQDC